MGRIWKALAVGLGVTAVLGGLVLIVGPPAPDFAGWDSDDWATLAQGVTAFVAVAAAVFAFFQVREARIVREDQARPFVVVDIQPSVAWGNILNLVVENIGKTLARDVTIKFDPPLESSLHGNDLAESPLFTQGIPSMPPGRRLSALFDLSHDRLSKGLPLQFTAKVLSSDARGRPQEPLEYVIDLEFLYGLEQVAEYGTHQVADALRKIEKHMAKWKGSGGRLAVSVRDEDARNKRERIQEAMTGSRPHLGSAVPSELLMAAGQYTIVRVLWRKVRSWRQEPASIMRRRGRRSGTRRPGDSGP